MAKTTCVGWICSFIRYHLGNQALQSKAAGRSCDQGGRLREAVGKETESPPPGGGDGTGRLRTSESALISPILQEGCPCFTTGKFGKSEVCSWADTPSKQTSDNPTPAPGL